MIAGIAGVNNDSPMRQGKPNAHYGKSLDQVKKDHESFVERSEFLGAYFENEMIGYLKVVYRGDVAAILNLAVKASHNDKRPANALIATAITRTDSSRPMRKGQKNSFHVDTVVSIARVAKDEL